MPDLDRTLGGNNVGMPAYRSHNAGPFRYQYRIDFSKEKDDSGNDLTTSDVLQWLNVSEYTMIEKVFVETLTAEGSTSTLDVGDDGSATRFIGGHDLNTQGAQSSYTAGYEYTSQDTIDLGFNTNGPTNAVIHLEIVVQPLKTELGSVPSNA